MKVPCKNVVQAGLRPVPTLWLDQPPVGDVHSGQFKTTRECARSRSWLSLEHGLTLLNSVELLEATLPVFATAPSNTRRSAGRSPRNQPSEEV